MKTDNRKKQLAKNTAIVALGQICTKFISFFLLPLYTALLSTEEYGIVDLLNTYISLLIPLIFLQMDQAIFRFLIEVRNKENEKSELISTTIITIFTESVIYLLVYMLIGKYINNEYKYFLATNVVINTFANIFLQISRGLGDNTTYSVGSLISGAGAVTLNVLFIVVLKMGARGMLLATLLANLLCATFIFFRKKIYKYIRISKFSKVRLKELWKYSIPLVPNQLSWWIVSASDRIIISKFINIAANGVYSAANKFSSLIITFFNIFNITWAESASMYFKDKDNSEYFSNIMNETIKLFSLFCLEVIAVMPFIFKFMITGESFASAYYQIPILLLSTIFNICVSLFGSIYVALKKTKEIAKTSIYAAIINIIVNIVFINQIGLYAASISTLIAYFAMAVYRYMDVQKYIKIKLDIKNTFINVFIAIVVTFLYYLRNNILSLLCLIILTIYTIYTNKRMISDIINNILNRVKRLRHN